MSLNGFINGDVDVPLSINAIEGLLGEIGALETANPTRKRAMVKLQSRLKRGVIPTSNLTAKAEFENRLHLLPASVVAMLQSGKMQLVDKQIYTARNIGASSNIELMSNADVSVVGSANINNRKLEAHQHFLLTGIILQSGVNVDPKAAAYDLPTQNIINGEFELQVGSTIVVPRTSCSVFNTKETQSRVGYYKLENPKIIGPQTEIKPELWTSAANAENTCVKIILVGVITEKN